MESKGETEPAKKIRSFTDLFAWQEGHKLVLQIYAITSSFPQSEQFRLTDQLCRAAVSVTSNVAEGFKRRTAKEKRQFYTTSLASLTEIQNQLLIARDLKYVDAKAFHAVAERSVTVSKLVMGLKKGAQDGK